MSILLYNNIALTPWRTLNLDIEPVYTEDRADVLYHRYTIEGTCVANPVATVGTGASSNLDVNINQMRRALLEPRQSLAFTLSEEENSLFIQSPPVDPSGSFLKADCDNGPHPQYCRILQVWGTQSVLVAYKISTTVSNCSKLVLANRWTLSHSVDANGFTTRRQRGRAILRSDLAWWTNGAPWILDQFRQWFFLPPPATFRRVGVEVTQSSDGLALDYTVTDREVRYGTGGNGGITRVEGHVTSGYSWPMKTVLEGVEAAVETAGDLVAIPFNFLTLNWGGAWGNMKSIAGRLPISNAQVTVRVHGQRNADMTGMANLAIWVAIDRLKPQAVLWFQNPIFYKAYLTQSLDSDGAPFVQLTAEALTSLLTAATQGAFGIGSLPEGQNLSSTIEVGGGRDMDRDNPTTTALPGSAGTRGSYIGSLFAQALTSGCSLPGLPVEDFAAPDAAQMI